jgi:hypothetical protein
MKLLATNGNDHLKGPQDNLGKNGKIIVEIGQTSRNFPPNHTYGYIEHKLY